MTQTQHVKTATNAKIAHFLGTMRPGHDGVTRVIYRLRALFARENAHHIFISPILPPVPPEDMRGVRSIPFPASTDYRISLTTARSIEKVLGKDVPDLIHIHSPCTLGKAAIRYALKRGIPIVTTYHTHFPTYMEYYHLEALAPITWGWLKSIYNKADANIIPSSATLKDLEAAGLPNLVYIPHGVDTSNFSPKHRSDAWRAEVAGPDHAGKVILTFVGRLVWEKNLLLLAQAFKLMKHRENVKLVIVGEGPARAKLEEMLPEAHFTGQLKEGFVGTAYASSDVFVFPSVTETFGNVTVEAMASGLPAICAAAGGAMDMVEPEKTGLLVSAEDPSELAAAMDRLATEPETRKRMSEAALVAVKRFEWESTTRRYESLYRQVMAVKKNPFAHPNPNDEAHEPESAISATG